MGGLVAHAPAPRKDVPSPSSDRGPPRKVPAPPWFQTCEHLDLSRRGLVTADESWPGKHPRLSSRTGESNTHSWSHGADGLGHGFNGLDNRRQGNSGSCEDGEVFKIVIGIVFFSTLGLERLLLFKGAKYYLRMGIKNVTSLSVTAIYRIEVLSWFSLLLRRYKTPGQFQRSDKSTSHIRTTHYALSSLE